MNMLFATAHEVRVAAIAGSFRIFGFSSPILIGEDGDVITGHGRLSIG